MIPYGYCQCGCGQKTKLARQSCSKKGWTRGEPIRFITGHHAAKDRPVDIPQAPNGCRYIPLTKGQLALVDEADHENLSSFTWFAEWSKFTNSFYASRSVRVDGRQRRIYMHRVVLGLEQGDPTMADHRNGNTLDNRRENLRHADASQNSTNRKRRSDNTTGYKGVSREKGNRFAAYIQVRGTLTRLGTFLTAEDAHAAYCSAAKELHGEFARTA